MTFTDAEIRAAVEELRRKDWLLSHNSRLFRIGPWCFSWGVSFHLKGWPTEAEMVDEARHFAADC